MFLEDCSFPEPEHEMNFVKMAITKMDREEENGKGEGEGTGKGNPMDHMIKEARWTILALWKIFDYIQLYTLSLKKVTLVKRSTVDFRSVIFSGMVDGKLV